MSDGERLVQVRLDVHEDGEDPLLVAPLGVPRHAPCPDSPGTLGRAPTGGTMRIV